MLLTIFGVLVIIFGILCCGMGNAIQRSRRHNKIIEEVKDIVNKN